MLIRTVLLAIAACGVATIIIMHESQTTAAPPAPPAPAVLRPATAQERQLLHSLVTAAPHSQGAMH